VTASRTSRHPGVATRGGLRARLVIAAVAAGAGAALTLGACSSGQITQTATQVPAVPGANFDAGPIALRNLVIAYNGPQGYAAGSDAPLVVRIFNNGQDAVTLTGVTSDKAASVALTGTPSVLTATATPTAAATTAQPTATAEATGTGTATAEPTGTATAQPTATAAAPSVPLSIAIPPQAYVLLVPGEGGNLVLHNLTTAIAPGESAAVTFTFSNHSTALVQVPLAPPVGIVPRGTSVVGGETSAGE
jgi:copper(I)-binding protein